jgi:hypothetical protein
VIIAADDAYFSCRGRSRRDGRGLAPVAHVPLHKVRAAFFTGGKIPALEAYRLGAVEKVVPRAALLGEARAFAAIIASKSRKALVLAKEALNGLEPRDVDHGYRFEQGFTSRCTCTRIRRKRETRSSITRAPRSTETRRGHRPRIHGCPGTFRAEVREWMRAHVPREPLQTLEGEIGFEQHRAWERTLAWATSA